jgi:hypothetical protein
LVEKLNSWFLALSTIVQQYNAWWLSIEVEEDRVYL